MTEENGFKMSPNKSDNFLDGYYLGNKQVQGRDGAFTVHTVHKVDETGKLAEKTDVVGNKVLNELMDTVKIGSYVGVQYMGRQLKKGNEGKNFSQTNSYHTWKLFVDEGAVKYNELGGSQETGNTNPPAKVESKQPVNNAPVSNPFPEDNDDLPF
jgi:hypothetical protein